METTTKHDEFYFADAMATWNSWPGVSGAQCSDCGCKINTPNHRIGWDCPNCDRFTHGNFSGGGYQFPWETPDAGPTLQTLRKAGRIAKKRATRQRKFADGQKVWVEVRQVHSERYGLSRDWRPAVIVSLGNDSCLAYGMRRYNVHLTGSPAYKWLGTDFEIGEEYIKPNRWLH